MRSGTDIRQARQDAGLTLREVCRRACISPPFLSDLERGKRFATPDVLARIAAAVGLEPTAVGQQAAIDRLMESEAGRPVARRLLAADARATAAEKRVQALEAALARVEHIAGDAECRADGFHGRCYAVGRIWDTVRESLTPGATGPGAAGEG